MFKTDNFSLLTGSSSSKYLYRYIVVQINATVDDRIIYIPIIKTCCIVGSQNWLKVLNLLPTSSCLLPVQLAGVKCQKKEIIIS